MERLRGFPPVIAPDSRILILGSFPSEASLAAAQYYAHPRNQFWRLLGAVLDEPLAQLGYAERLERMLMHQVGLWDIVAACERRGSLDTAIRNATLNGLETLRRRAPALEKVCFNGATAGRLEPTMRMAGYRTLILPSSSPAHAARSFGQKLERWREIPI